MTRTASKQKKSPKPKDNGDTKTSQKKKKAKKSSTLILKNGEQPKIVETFLFKEDVERVLDGFKNEALNEETSEKDEAKKKKSNAGRKSTITEFVLSKLHEGFSMDFTIEEACTYAGISDKAYYRYIKQNPQFRELILAMKNIPFITAKRTLINEIKRGDSKKALEFLERRQKGLYSPRVENVNTNLNADVGMVDQRTERLIKTSLGAFGNKLAELAKKNQAKADKKR